MFQISWINKVLGFMVKKLIIKQKYKKEMEKSDRKGDNWTENVNTKISNGLRADLFHYLKKKRRKKLRIRNRTSKPVFTIVAPWPTQPYKRNKHRVICQKQSLS